MLENLPYYFLTVGYSIQSGGRGLNSVGHSESPEGKDLGLSLRVVCDNICVYFLNESILYYTKEQNLICRSCSEHAKYVDKVLKFDYACMYILLSASITISERFFML